jgi:hypothetical protein
LKKVLLFISLFTLLFSSSVFAHVTNEKTIYDDIEFSEAKEEIVYLRGLEVIAYEHGAKLFKPQDTLTKADLAFWAVKFKGLDKKQGEHGHGGDSKKEDIQKLAIDHGLIDSLEGNATHGDVNKAYFEGKAPVEKPDQELTKEEFALFMGQFLKEKVDGKTLFDMVGFEPGPTGVVEKVSFEMEGEGEKAYKVFRYTIGGKEYQVSKHPKILYGPVDLSAWEGKKTGESWLTSGHGDEKVVQIIVVDKGQFTDDEIAKQDPKDQPDQQNQDENQRQDKPAESITENDTVNKATEQPEKGFPVVPVVGGVILVGILGWLFMKKK